MYIRNVFNQKTSTMSISKTAVIEEVEYQFAFMIEKPEDAIAIADEVIDLFEMLAVMEYLGPNTDAFYMGFAMQAYHHSISSMRGEMFVEQVKRQYKAWRATYSYVPEQ